jgi:cytochrome c biogenesis protein ResB
MWLFFVLILSTLAVVCVGCAIYLRVRRHMKTAAGDPHQIETGHPAGEAR